MSSNVTDMGDYRKQDRAQLIAGCGVMASHEYRCMPLQPMSKIPKLKSWTNIDYNASFKPAKDETGYGVVLGDNTLVVDIDPRNFAVASDGKVIDSFQTLIDLMGVSRDEALDTFTVRSGRATNAGIHLYYKKPVGRIRKKLKSLPGVEFLSSGAYVVGPGSLHPESGLPYKIIAGSLDNLKDIPKALFELLLYTDTITTEELTGEDDTPERRERFRQMLITTEPAVQGNGGDLITLKVAMNGRDLGLPAETTLDLMLEHFSPRCSPPWSSDELRVKVYNAYRYGRSDAGCASAGSVKTFKDYIAVDSSEQIQHYIESSKAAGLIWFSSKNEAGVSNANQIRNSGLKQNYLQNVVNFFKLDNHKTFTNPIADLLRFNQFNYQIEFTHAPPWPKAADSGSFGTWTDRDAEQLKYYLQTHWFYNANVQTIHEAASVYAIQNSYHPVRDYFDTLRWDGSPRLDQLLPFYAGASDNKYTRAVGKNVMIAAVGRIFRPGCKFDHMLILEGPQGVGKSTFCDVLGRDWFANLNLCFKGGMKEVIPLTLGKLIIEVSEMGVIRQAEVETLKMFLSSRKDPVRMCYDKYATDVPRQSILIGTINPESDGQYLRDTTGNRRFWPVKVGRFKIKELERDINQLWAEAVHRFREGENFYFDDPDLVREAKREQLKREVTDPWLELLLCYLSGYEKNTIELRTIIRYALDLHSRVTASDSARINRIMESQGWAKVITDSSIYYTKLTLESDI